MCTLILVFVWYMNWSIIYAITLCILIWCTLLIWWNATHRSHCDVVSTILFSACIYTCIYLHSSNPTFFYSVFEMLDYSLFVSYYLNHCSFICIDQIVIDTHQILIDPSLLRATDVSRINQKRFMERKVRGKYKLGRKIESTSFGKIFLCLPFNSLSISL